ncbi:MAG TPA: NAD-dependent epimerase/dehydratase family protein, partial [Nitrospinaceae bacterium]|nr:NAD-dependent epimerase/dehydratase family protein [Nitrospinaceae bacterium]
MFESTYKGRRVLVTGHTGFKGSWLCAWLLDLGATVAGFSANIPTKPSHFEVLRLTDRIEHFEGDVRNKSSL